MLVPVALAFSSGCSWGYLHTVKDVFSCTVTVEV